MRSFLLNSLLAIGLVIVPSQVPAQVQFGLKAGATLTSLDKKFDPFAPLPQQGESLSGWGYHAGVFLETNTEKKLAFHGELLFDVRRISYAFSTGVPSDPGRWVLSMSTLEAPFCMAIRAGKALQFDLGAGPLVLVAADQRDRGGVSPNTFDRTEDRMSYLKKVRFALFMDCAYRFTSRASVSIRYAHPFGVLLINEQWKVTGRMFQFSLGYVISKR